jgi:hypothetical protein
VLLDIALSFRRGWKRYTLGNSSRKLDNLGIEGQKGGNVGRMKDILVEPDQILVCRI